MAWIVPVPPSARHPRRRWRVRLPRPDGFPALGGHLHHGTGRQGHETTPRPRRTRRNHPNHLDEAVDQHKALTLFGDYVTTTWWPRWRDGHPHSAYLYGKRIEKRILPTFADVRFIDLDADRVGDWKAKLVAEGLAAQTINAYLSLLGTILNAAVDSDYLPRSPMRRRSGAGRVEAAKNQRVARREVWLTRAQLDRLADAISPRYRALVLTAALTGLRRGELTALRWDDLQPIKPFDDGAVAGPGRVRVVRAQRPRQLRPRSGQRPQDRGQQAHRRPGPGDRRRPDGPPGPGRRRELGRRVHHARRLPGSRRSPDAKQLLAGLEPLPATAKLAPLWQEHGGLHFHDLRHTHATWLLARRVPLVAVANRLGHANSVITMMVYAHVDRLVERGEVTAEELGLNDS